MSVPEIERPASLSSRSREGGQSSQAQQKAVILRFWTDS